LAVKLGPAVLAGVGKGCEIAADVAAWEGKWDVATEGGVWPGDVAVADMAERPLDCEFIEEQGGEVGVRG
jgi:hypothetical protein